MEAEKVGIWQREPVAVVGAIMSVVSALMVFGVLNWTAEEATAFQDALIALIPLVMGGVATYFSRQQVTPVKAPRTEDGQPAMLVPKK